MRNKTIAPAAVALILLLVLLSGFLPTEDEVSSSEDNSIISYISLEGTGISLNGGGATVDGSTITISSAGTFIVKGTLDDGQIIVDTTDNDPVILVLNETSITCSTSAPIYVVNADSTVIFLTPGTQNFLTDGETYVFASSTEDEPNAALFSNDDLIIHGDGALIVDANYHNGIQSDDDLTIEHCNITITAKNHGLKGKDSILISYATIDVTAGNDGMQSDNDEDVSKGYISIESSSIDITSVDDGINAETKIWIIGSTISITSSVTNGKGIKAGSVISIYSGFVTINSANDAIHSDGSIAIKGGNIALSAVDDGIHAETSLQIDGGSINITQCYEGLEAEVITVNGGSVHIISSDDGVNAVGDSASFSISGGNISVNALGDGFDINGGMSMSGGMVLINGPTANDNGALDYDASFPMTGGFLVAVGSSGMAMAPSNTTASTQYSVIIGFTSTLSADALFNIQSNAGEEIVTFAPTKQYQTVVVSSSKFVKNGIYKVYTGGSHSGMVADSLYSGGTYNNSTATLAFTFTMVAIVTGVGSIMTGPVGPPGPPSG